MIDWRLRQEVHQTLFNFITNLGIEKTLELFAISLDFGGVGVDPNQPGPSNNNAQPSDSMSFNKTVTMPAVLWTSRFDPYGQAADAASSVFTTIYPTPEAQINFLFDHYETILDYCVVNIFDPIPIKLFYHVPMPADSVRTFEEHMLVTSMRGLSVVINELICFYLQPETIDQQLQPRALATLQAIFLRINEEFVKRSPKTIHLESNDADGKGPKEDEELAHQAAESSKKEKKKKLKKDQPEDDGGGGGGSFNVRPKHCRFWDYDRSRNDTVRLATSHALNSFTRLTTLLVGVNEEEHIFEEQTFDKSDAWYLHYKVKFYELVFDHLFDAVLEVRGLGWLLASHLLLNEDLYQPWATIDVSRFLERLSGFFARGMRTEGGLLDFGLFNLNLERYMLLYPEYFAKKMFYLSGAQLVLEKDADAGQAANGKLIIVFVQAFHQQQKFRIFASALDSLSDGLRDARLRRDIDFMQEVYYNLVYYYMYNCYRLAWKDTNDEADGGGGGGNETGESFKNVRAVEKLSEEIFNKYLLKLETLSWKEESKVFYQTSTYLNLLLLSYNTNQLYHELSTGPMAEFYKPNLLLYLYEQFKGRVADLYHHMFRLAHTELVANLEGKSVLPLDRMLKFLNEAIYFRDDGYFSSEYYYTANSMAYDLVAYKIASAFKKPGPVVGGGGGGGASRSSHRPERRAVRFQSGGESNANRKKNKVAIAGAEEEANWWMQYQMQSIFFSTLANPATGAQRSKFNTEYSISLYKELPSVQKEMSEILLDLWRLFDRRLVTFDSNTARPTIERKRDLFNIVLHLQYVLRGFSGKTLVQLCPLITKTTGAKVVTEYADCLKALIGDFFIRWLDTSATFCDMIDDGHRADYGKAREELSFQVIICRKIFDVLLVLLVKIYDDHKHLPDERRWRDMVDSVLDVLAVGLRPYSYCVLVHHLSRLSTKPITARYTAVNIQCKEFLVDRFRDRAEQLVYAQLVQLFTANTAINLNCNIFIDLLAFTLNQSNLCYAKRFPVDFQLRVGSQVLAQLYNFLEPKPKCELLDYQLFPSLCAEIYKLLFEESSKLTLVEGFTKTLADYVRLFVRQTFERLGKPGHEDNQDGEAMDIEKDDDDFDSSSAFYKLAISQLFRALPMFEQVLEKIVLESLEFVCHFVFERVTLNEHNYRSIERHLLEFSLMLVDNFKAVVIKFGLYDRDDPELVGARKGLTNFTEQMLGEYAKLLSSFEEQTELGVALWEVSNNNNNTDWFGAFDLLLGRASDRLLAKLNNTADNKPEVSMDKLAYVTICLTSVTNTMLGVFLDSAFEGYLGEEAATTLELLLGRATDFGRSLVFRLIKLLAEANYYLDRHFKRLAEVESSTPTKRSVLATVLIEAETKLTSIVDTVLSRLQATSVDSAGRFAAFVVDNEKLAFGQYCLEHYFPDYDWSALMKMLVVEDIDRTKPIDAGKLIEAGDCFHLLHEVDDVWVQEQIRRTLAQYGPTESAVLPCFDWKRLAIKEKYGLLLFCGLIFTRLGQRHQTGEEGEEVERLRLALLSLSKHLDVLEPVDVLQQYGLFILFEQAVSSDAILAHTSLSTVGRHYRALFEHQKAAISSLYYSMPSNDEAPGQTLSLEFELLALVILKSFDRFCCQVVDGWLTKEDNTNTEQDVVATTTSSGGDDVEAAQPSAARNIQDEVQKTWRNFLAFNSYNVLLPIFVTLSETISGDANTLGDIDRSWMERTLAKQVINAVRHVDSEALVDIATLEANQVLLPAAADESSVSSRMKHLKSIIESTQQQQQQHPSSAGFSNTKVLTPNMIPLVSSNPYYNFVLTHGVELLLHADPTWALSSFQVLLVLMQSRPWERTKVATTNESGAAEENDNDVHREQLQGGQKCL